MYDGIKKYDPVTGQVSSFSNNIQHILPGKSRRTYAIFIDKDAIVWIGTKGGGLNQLYKGNKFSAIDTRMGLANDVIHGILEDKYGKIWVSTNKGLSRITFLKNNLPFKKGDIKIENFTIADGLQSNQFSSAALKTSDGQLFFGGINGISYFNPQKNKSE